MHQSLKRTLDHIKNKHNKYFLFIIVINVQQVLIFQQNVNADKLICYTYTVNY